MDAVAAILVRQGTSLTEETLTKTMSHPARRLSLEMEAWAGEHKVALHDSESAKQFLEAAEQGCAGAYSGQQGQELLAPANHPPAPAGAGQQIPGAIRARRWSLSPAGNHRLFALKRLAEAGETAYIRRQHFAWCLHLAEDGAALLGGPNQEVWFARLEQEHDNFRAALSWGIDEGRADEATRLALGLWRFWRARTYQREGLRWLEQLRALDTETSPLPAVLRPRLFHALGVLAHLVRQYDQATAYHAEALRPWRESDDQAEMAMVLLDRGYQHFDEAFAQAVAEGRRMTMDKFLTLAEHLTMPEPHETPPPPSPPRAPHTDLTPREVEVLRLVAKGWTNAQVAEALIITPHTVNAHLTAIYGKLGVTSRAGAIRYALEHRLD